VANPWIGLGMGFTYRPWDRRIDEQPLAVSDYDFRKHIHNGHLWILLQSGLLGYLSFVWLSVAFLIQGFGHWRRVADAHFRGVMLGFTVIYLGILIAAFVNSTFVQWRWTPVIGMMMGINEVIRIQFSQKTLGTE
jgi:O-antigen ligase